jgi:hypothetical protein
VWLPLPHLLNALPVQLDAFYRTGASGVAMSVVSFAVATAAITWIIAVLTRSSWAAMAGAAVFALNPNVLYLQATPMTEPLLLATTLVAVALLIAWCVRLPGPSPALVGWAFALACMTRYEAWPVTVSALGAAAWARWRGGDTPRDSMRAVWSIGVYPLAAIAAFVVFSRVVIGAWFVSGGFFLPDNPAQGHPYAALSQIAWGTWALSGSGVLAAAAVGVVVLVVTSLTDRRRAVFLVPLALTGTLALPWTAFMEGHPYRIRYMVPLIAAQAVCAGIAAGTWKRRAAAAPLALLVLAITELNPLDRSAAMVVEAQWDRPNAAGRQRVTDCLAARYGGETIMASMGSLGHYMQELSAKGFRIRDFLHEGNGDIWLTALDQPRAFAGWILLEEEAEGGDMLADRSRGNRRFLDGFSRVCEGAGVALYRRMPPDGGEAVRAPRPLEPHVEGRHVGPATKVDLRP